MDHPLADQIYPSDVIARARSLRSEIGSVGAYSHSKGVLAIRQRVAKFIEGASRMRWCTRPVLTRGDLMAQSAMDTPRTPSPST